MDGQQLVHQGFRGTASGNGKVADLRSHAYSIEHVRDIHTQSLADSETRQCLAGLAHV